MAGSARHSLCVRGLTVPKCAVRILPLGSPWSPPNALYVHYRRRRRWLRQCGAGVYGVRYRVGWGRGSTQPVHIQGQIQVQIQVLVLPGPNQSQIPVSARPPGTPGPSRPLRTPGSSRTQHALLDPIQARFSLKYPKVSHKPGVSSVLVHEAWHSPCFKTASISHDLEFPGFRYTPAFSHKE